MASPAPRPPERRRVLGSSTASISSPTTSLPASRPIRARVDPSNVTTSPSAAQWTPSQPVRARVQLDSRGGVVSSAPATPGGSGSPFARGAAYGSQGVSGSVRATLSPQTSSARGTSPVRSRSPDLNAARPLQARVPTSTTPRATPTARLAPADTPLLRGQSDPFPTVSSPSQNSTPTPISYLPSSVSVRRLNSPTLRSSPSTVGRASNASSSAESSCSVPPLSTSPGSCASSPLTSPALRGQSYDGAPVGATLSPGPEAYYDGSVGRKAGSAARKLSGTSNASSASSADGSLLPPVSVSGDERFPFPSFSPNFSSPVHSPPLKSPSVQSFPSHTTPTGGISRSPAISSISSSRTIKASLSASTSRPPIAASNASNRHRHARSQSTTSTSSRSSALSSQSHDDYPNQAASWSHARSPVASPSLRPARPALSAVDWTASPTPALSPPPAAPRPRLRTSSGSEGAISWSTGFVEREMDEQEKEAKVERRIADLEIRNASLLSINTSLERLKVKHTNEIRELRRKLRESIGGAGLAALRVQATKLVEGDDAGGEHPDDSEDEVDSDGEREVEPTWQELLDGDPTFSALAGTVEALIARAKRAVEYEPAGSDVAGGRVLSTVEMEDRLRMEDGVEAEEEEELSSGIGTSPELSRASTPATSAASSSAAVSGAEKGLGIRGWQRQPR